VFKFRKFSLFTFLAFFLCFSAQSQFYSGSQMQFGKNRVQYDHFEWNYYDYGSYKVYFYTAGDKIARYVGDKAKKYIDEISTFMDYQLDGEIEFIVFNKESEYRQSNLGLNIEGQYNTGGMNRIVGRKIILYFEGDHEKLNEQIRQGIASVLFKQMMYGGSFANVIKGSTLLNIPPWFEDGFINYMATGWNPELDNRVRDGIQSGRYKKFNHLSGMDATYAGLSLWNYIAQTYGETVIPNILYLTRSSRSVESAFLFVLGVSIKSLTADWLNYYQAQYKKDASKESVPKNSPIVMKPKKTRVYFHLKVSPDGRYVVYSTNELGKDKVWFYDMQTKKRKCILKQGNKTNRVLDYSYPLLTWHPTGELFSIIMEEQGKLMLYTYTLSNHKLESRRIVNFQKILDFSYADDGTKFVMSAVQDGQTDLFVFTAASNAYEQITKDVYDDMNPRFTEHSTKIVFSSNRPDDTLRLGGDYKKMQEHSDIFVYNYATHSNILRRITNTPGVDETDPTGFGGSYISYLSSATGLINRYLAYVDSAISFVDTSAHYRYVVHSYPVTDYTRNILEQDVSSSLKNYSQVMFYKGKYWMYQDTMLPLPTSYTPVLLKNTSYMSQHVADEHKKERDDSIARILKKDSALLIKIPPSTAINNTPVIDTSKKKTDTTHIAPAHKPVDINDYTFDPKAAENKQSVTIITFNSTPNSQPTITKPKDTLVVHHDSGSRRHVLERQNYHISFSPDYVIAQLDNSFLNQSYQVYTGGATLGPIFQDPGLDVFLSAGLSDLFEDYRIDGGVRISFDFTNNEYFLSYTDLSSRLDKQLILYRGANSYTFSDGALNGYTEKVYTHSANYILKWPFSEVARIEGNMGLRLDENVLLGIDQPSLETPNTYNLTPNAELAYVYDATLPVELNINYGFKAKVFAQYYRNWNAKDNMYILGFDARYYQKISRDLIWANRIAGGTSLGQQELIYFMGGVDNWITPKFDNTISVDQTQNYAFQTLATPMRGFNQNIRNGNSFFLFNSELRFPIFHYLFNHPIKSDFFNTFQIIAFGDIGTAWTGLTPYSNENAVNQTVVGAPGNPITVILSTQQDPFVEGVGMGIRARVVGYFLRLDEAWGINNGAISNQPITYFSLSLDF
jgi:hypothetical protein